MLEPAPGVDLAMTIANLGQMAGGVQKDPNDLERYKVIIAETQPDLVIETGTDTGNSASWFATQGLHVITVDIDPSRFVPPAGLGVLRVIGDSTTPGVYNEVFYRARGYQRIMVSLDSDHSFEHVAREIDIYARMVTPGCYLVVEDGIFAFLPPEEQRGYEGVLPAIEAKLLDRENFERDFDVEGLYPTTGSIAGWWRRVS